MPPWRFKCLVLDLPGMGANLVLMRILPDTIFVRYASFWVSREACFYSESGLSLNLNTGFPLYKSKIIYYPVSKFVLI